MIKFRIMGIWYIFNYIFGVWMVNSLIFYKILNNPTPKTLICTLIMSLCEILIVNKILFNNLDVDYKIIDLEENNNDED